MAPTITYGNHRRQGQLEERQAIDQAITPDSGDTRESASRDISEEVIGLVVTGDRPVPVQEQQAIISGTASAAMTSAMGEEFGVELRWTRCAGSIVAAVFSQCFTRSSPKVVHDSAQAISRMTHHAEHQKQPQDNQAQQPPVLCVETV